MDHYVAVLNETWVVRLISPRSLHLAAEVPGNKISIGNQRGCCGNCIVAVHDVMPGCCVVPMPFVTAKCETSHDSWGFLRRTRRRQ